MNNKIVSIEQNYGALDIDILKASLEAGDIEEMDSKEIVRHAFVKQGSIPNRIMVKEASDFGLKHSYFDVWKPVDEAKTGVWIMEKDSSGQEWIVRAEDSK